MDLIRRVGINRLALPVAEQASRFIAQRSADDAGVRAKEAAGHRKRGMPSLRLRNDTLIGSVHLT